MKTLQRIVAIILIVVILLADAAVPVYAQGPSDLLSNFFPQREERPLTKAVAKLTAKPSIKPEVLGLADNNRSGERSARQRIPIKLEKLKRTNFKATEKVMLMVSNPDMAAIETKVVDTKGEEIPVIVDTVTNGIVTELQIDPSNQFKPGKYTVEISDDTGQTIKQDFIWGVLALNTDKSVYTPHESADISIAVLNELGEMVCDAKTELKIINKETKEEDVLSTKDGTIVINKECHSKAFTLKPDYEVKYTFDNIGRYDMVLTAETQNGSYTISEPIEVKESVPFAIKRTSATRLYPPLDYPMNIEITANQDFEGTITETVPDSFTITPSDENTSYDGLKTLYLNGKSPESGILGAKSGSLQMPFDGNYTVSQGFGTSLTDIGLSKFYAKYGLAGHDGIDFALPMGTPLYAVDDGNIIWSGPGDYGVTVIIEHAWGRSYYGHLSKTNLDTGYTVKKGELLGYSGNTGESTGPHLHFGMKPKDPDIANGYSGKIDPAPYLSGLQMVPEAFTKAINSSGVLSATIAAHDHEQEQASVSAVESLSTPHTEEIKPAEGKAVTDIVPFAKSSPSSTSTAQLRQEAVTIAPGVKAENFTLLSQEVQKEVAGSESVMTDKVKVLKWKVSLKKGERTTLSYTYKAPQVSPQFYLLGTIKMFDNNGESVYEEASKWQLAADAIGAHWYDTSWRYRKTLTINNAQVNATLTNFAVLVSLTSDADLSSKAQADGDDILFTDSTGQTKLDHEIQSYSSGTLVAWVEVPTLADTTDTNIYMYYGNATASSQQNPTGVWDASTVAAYHMEENPAGTAPQIQDSTTNNLDLTSNGSMTSGDLVTGKIGSSIDFDGTNDYLSRADNSLFEPATNMTISFWVYINQLATSKGEDTVFVAKPHSSAPFFSYQMYQSRFDDGVYIHWGNSSGSEFTTDPNTDLSATTWHNVVYVKNGSAGAIYYNGVDRTLSTSVHSGTIIDSNGSFNVGAFDGSQKRANARMDEVKFMSTARASGWVSTEYNSQNSPATFYSVGGEETRAYAPAPGELMRHGKYFDTAAGGEQAFVY